MLNRSDVEWVTLFTQEAVQGRQLSASTLEAYTLDLAVLCRWAAGREQGLLDLSTTDLTRYIVERAAQGTQQSTLARHLSSFRRFFAFLVSHRAITASPAAAVIVPQAPRHESGLVRDDVLRMLLRSPHVQFPTLAAAYRAQRDHAIVCMLYGTGLGISDVRLLRWQQIDEHRHVVRAPLRNGVLRSFVLDSSALEPLVVLRYAAATDAVCPATSPYCFPTASGLPMTRQAFCHVVRKWATERGLAQVVTPSSLRQAGRAHRFGRRLSRPAPALARIGFEHADEELFGREPSRHTS